jgi:PPOX class probable F420-dependent enzyme
VVFALVEDALYTAVDDKPKTTKALVRLANIEATGQASVLVDEYSEDWSTLWWVRVDGPAQVLGPESSRVPVAVQALARKYPQYASRHLGLPAGPVICLQVSRWHSWEATPTA